MHSVYIKSALRREASIKRLAVLSGLVIVGVICLATAGEQPATLAIQKVKDNLYMITGAGGNTAAFIPEKGVVVVDTTLPGTGPAILCKVKSGTTKPVMMI